MAVVDPTGPPEMLEAVNDLKPSPLRVLAMPERRRSFRDIEMKFPAYLIALNMKAKLETLLRKSQTTAGNDRLLTFVPIPDVHDKA